MEQENNLLAIKDKANIERLIVFKQNFDINKLLKEELTCNIYQNRISASYSKQVVQILQNILEIRLVRVTFTLRYSAFIHLRYIQNINFVNLRKLVLSARISGNYMKTESMEFIQMPNIEQLSMESCTLISLRFLSKLNLAHLNYACIQVSKDHIQDYSRFRISSSSVIHVNNFIFGIEDLIKRYVTKTNNQTDQQKSYVTIMKNYYKSEGEFVSQRLRILVQKHVFIMDRYLKIF